MESNIEGGSLIRCSLNAGIFQIHILFLALSVDGAVAIYEPVEESCGLLVEYSLGVVWLFVDGTNHIEHREEPLVIKRGG